MSEEVRAPWDKLEAETPKWFIRFERFRLQGPGRTIEDTWRAEESKGKRPGRQWYEKAQAHQWRARAEAWDCWMTEQIAGETERRWRSAIMSKGEILGRLSEMGRGDITDICDFGPDGHIKGFRAGALEKYGYRIKKVTSSKGKTESIGVEMYDAQGAMDRVAKATGAYEKEHEVGDQINHFMLPADLIAPSFLADYRDIRDRKHTEYLFKGGRGSTKSSFVSLAIIYLLLNNPDMHALAARQVKDTLRNSVYAQLEWAINQLGLDDEFKCAKSPLEITYLPTGQTIFFRGADDPAKIKSIKPEFGYIGIAWFEELDQFHGEESIRKIEQSVIRGGDDAFIFKSFNPPRTKNNWANKYAMVPKATQRQSHSTYLDVPPEWLGKAFLSEAEHLKQVNPAAYEHEYLGIANGSGGMVFENVQLRAIPDEEIAKFDRILMGNDWGYFPDPYAWVKMYYDAARHTLYIFDEHRVLKASNRQTYQALTQDHGVKPGDVLIADSAEPKSVADYREYGLNCYAAEKGPELGRLFHEVDAEPGGDCD